MSGEGHILVQGGLWLLGILIVGSLARCIIAYRKWVKRYGSEW